MSLPLRDRRPSARSVSVRNVRVPMNDVSDVPESNVQLTTAHSLHALAEQVIAADLYQRTGKIGLRVTPGGFGTPRFDVDGSDRRVRVDGLELVVEEGVGERRAPLTTIRAAAELVGVDPGAPDVYTAVMPFDPSSPLELDAGAAHDIAEWLRLVDDALAHFSTDHSDESPSIAQLWPEHFDLAITMGEANYGGSPPDDDLSAPYLYVGPWKPRTGEFWTEPYGASRIRRDDMTVDDALAFFEDGRRHIVTDPAA
jgi:hypothetical protein